MLDATIFRLCKLHRDLLGCLDFLFNDSERTGLGCCRLLSILQNVVFCYFFRVELVLVDALWEPLQVPGLFFLGEELGLVEAFGYQADALVGSIYFHQALDWEILFKDALDNPKLPFYLLLSLFRQFDIGLFQDLCQYLAFTLDVVNLECLFERVELHKVLALDLVIGKVVLCLRILQFLRDATIRACIITFSTVFLIVNIFIRLLLLLLLLFIILSNVERFFNIFIAKCRLLIVVNGLLLCFLDLDQFGFLIVDGCFVSRLLRLLIGLILALKHAGLLYFVFLQLCLCLQARM